MCTTGLTERFEESRPRLRAVAYRMLGSVDDAEDAVQDAWLRLNRNPGEIDNVDAWLTTVVARICLNMLRARRVRGEEELVERLPDPIIDPPGEFDPEHRVLLADTVGLALFVVLDTLPPDERLAFELHDEIAEPFDEMACQALMRAHAVAGNRAEALRVYANCRKLFRDELGAEPSEQTAAVFLSILRAGVGSMDKG